MFVQALGAGITEGIGHGIGLAFIGLLAWRGYRHFAKTFGNQG